MKDRKNYHDRACHIFRRRGEPLAFAWWQHFRVTKFLSSTTSDKLRVHNDSCSRTSKSRTLEVRVALGILKDSRTRTCVCWTILPLRWWKKRSDDSENNSQLRNWKFVWRVLLHYIGISCQLPDATTANVKRQSSRQLQLFRTEASELSPNNRKKDVVLDKETTSLTYTFHVDMFDRHIVQEYYAVWRMHLNWTPLSALSILYYSTGTRCR